MDGGAWWAAVHGVAESDTTERLHFHFSLSCPGEGNGNPLQCSCLENPKDGGAWWAAVYGVAQSQTRLTRLSSSSSSVTWIQGSEKYLYFKTNVCVSVCVWCVCVCSVVSNSLRPLDCSQPGSSVHGISQARILEWVDIFSCGGSS